MHGPLVTEFHADRKFHHYKSGILTQDEIPEEPSQNEEIFVPTEYLLQVDEPKLGQSVAQSQAQMAYQELDHTIFVLGWGVDADTGTKYWIVRNSYGDHWGMNGDFHVKRGNNDYGIESELSGYNVELILEENKKDDNEI